MSILRKIAVAGSVIGLTFGTVAAAQASTSTTHNLNLRTGPSMHYHVRAVIPAGSHIDIHSCGSVWCVVYWAGQQGYVDGHYLVTHVTHTVPALSHVHY